MAPACCPLQLLFFFSLVSSSGSFLMKRSSVQFGPGPSGLRHFDDVASYPFRSHVHVKRQNTIGRRRGNKPVEYVAVKLGKRPGSVSNTKGGRKFVTTLSRFPLKFNDLPQNLANSNIALNYLINGSSKFPQIRKSDGTGNYVSKNFSWHTLIPFKRTWQMESKYTDQDSNRPDLDSLDVYLYLYNKQKSSFQNLPQNEEKSVVFNTNFHHGRTGESKLWISVMNLKNAIKALSADNMWLNFLRRDRGTASQMTTETNTENKDVLNNAGTVSDEDSFNEATPSPAANTRLWWNPSHTSPPTRNTPHKRFQYPDDVNTETAEPVSKPYPVPLQKKVFVYGHDDRLRVFLPQMRKFPFSNIARLSTGCTGTLVTPRHVLTAAHCVHNGLGFRNNLEKLKIEIPDTMGFKDYYAQKITIPTGWLRENRSGRGWQSGKRAVYDYAVVRLKLAVTGRTKFLPLAVPRPEVLQMDFHFLAFPQDDQQLWRSVCLASQHMALGDGNLILTRCDAAVGNSGAAVFIQDPHGGLRVVGILSNTMHVGHHRSFFRYSIITALTWPKLTDICNELGLLGRKYNVCPPMRFMRRTTYPPRIKVIPFFGKRSPQGPGSSGEKMVL